MRTAQGLTLMPLTGAGGTYEFLRSQVNAGKVVALLSDRDLSGSGMGVTFFSNRAPLPIGAALLGIDTGRPIFTLSSWYDGQSLVIEFDNEIVIDEPGLTGRDRLRQAQVVTSQIANQLEQHIIRHPSDWHMLQPIWPDLIASK
jgi:KDO2-lipid IV(A) lauroyltransferase